MELAVQTVGPYDHVLEIARLVENAGAAAISLADHYLYGTAKDGYPGAAYDSLVQAAALGRDTTAIEIVMLVSPITFRHPAVYAKSAITIDELSGGRFVLGLGAGWHDDEHGWLGIPYPDMNERFLMLEDALGYVRQFFDDPSVGFQSERYSFNAHNFEPRARHDLRILVGGRGPTRTPRLAGTFAGEYGMAVRDPEDTISRIAKAREAAERAGCDPDALMITLNTTCIGGDNDAALMENLGLLGLRTGKTAEEVKAYWEGRGLMFRTYEEHRDRLGRFAECGVTRAYLQLSDGHPEVCRRALAELS